VSGKITPHKFLPGTGRGTAKRWRGGSVATVGTRLLCLTLPSHPWTATSPVSGRIIQLLYSLTRCLCNIGNNAFEAPQHIGCRNAQGENAMRRKPRIAALIPRWPVTAIMRFTVHFDAQLRLVTIKVERESSGGMLLSPMMARLFSAQFFPQQYFGQRHFPAQFARLADRFAGSLEHCLRLLSRFTRPSTMLRMVPLPEASSGRNFRAIL